MSNGSRISPTLIIVVATAGIPCALLSCKGENERSNEEPSTGGSAEQGGSTGQGGSSDVSENGGGSARAETGGSSSSAAAGGAEASSSSSTGGSRGPSGGSRASGGTRAIGGASTLGGSRATSGTRAIGGAPALGGASAPGGATGVGDAGGRSSCSAGEVGAPPNCFSSPPVAPASGKQWSVTFSEEFDGTDYDHNKLSPCFDWNYGDCTNSFNNGREHYDPAQVQVNGGTGKLIAAPLSPPLSSTGCYQDQCTYKSGLLSTCRPNAGNNSNYLYAFTYGYVEARMKFPGTRGFFTAFWMLPTSTNYDYRSEIDIVEILGDDPESIFMTYHYNDRSESHAVNNSTKDNGACPVKDYSTDFHKFGLDWQSDHVAWYIDGVKCDQFTGTTAEIENGPMQIILDLMVDHDWQQRWGVMLQDTTLVRQIEVDYLRVYQQK